MFMAPTGSHQRVAGLLGHCRAKGNAAFSSWFGLDPATRQPHGTTSGRSVTVGRGGSGTVGCLLLVASLRDAIGSHGPSDNSASGLNTCWLADSGGVSLFFLFFACTKGW